MNTPDTDDETGAFEHRLTDAASAPRVSGSIPNSVFAMGGSAPASTKPLRAIRGMAARAVLAIDACGPLDAAQLAEVLGLTRQQAHNIGHHGVATGYLVKQQGRDGQPPTYGLVADAKARAELTIDKLAEQTPAMKGFKEWLTKKGAVSAEGRAPAPKGAAVPARRRTAAPALVAAPAQPELQASLRYAMFNDGTLRIEAGDAALTLPPLQASELLAFITSVHQAIGRHAAA